MELGGCYVEEGELEKGENEDSVKKESNLAWSHKVTDLKSCLKMFHHGRGDTSLRSSLCSSCLLILIKMNQLRGFEL